MNLHPPEPLGENHGLEHFDSGAPSLNEWLRRRARANQISGASRTFVVTGGGREVAGYFSLASGAIQLLEARGGFRRNMPDPIPVVILARLAVALPYQKLGLGRAMIGEAAKKVLAAGEGIGVRGLVVHALSEEAAAFYCRLGFTPSPSQPLSLMISLLQLRASL